MPRGDQRYNTSRMGGSAKRDPLRCLYLTAKKVRLIPGEWCPRFAVNCHYLSDYIISLTLIQLYSYTKV